MKMFTHELKYGCHPCSFLSSHFEKYRISLQHMYSHLMHLMICLLKRWEDNTKMDFREVGWGGIDWIDLAQDRDRWRTLVNTVMNLRVP
jgi:hypothetical protein